MTTETIPDCRVIEGASTLQSVCPVCQYGDGYNESFIAGMAEFGPVTCKTCGTTFRALYMLGRNK